MTIYSAELFPQCLPFGAQPKPTSNPHRNPVVNCRNLNPNIRKSRNAPNVKVSTETRPTHLHSYDFKETHLMKLLNRSCKAGKYSESLYFLDCMVNRGYKPDVILCTKLIKGFFNSKNVGKAVKVMEILEAHGEPDVFAYNAVISGFCKLNQIESANKGLTPDTYTFDPLIAALCKEGRLDLAIAFLDYMISSGCLPDLVNYNTILSALGKNGNGDQALAIFDKLGEMGCPPDVSSYNTMISALWNNQDQTRALRIVSEMINKGIDPDEITYNSLISCFCRDGMVDEAIVLLGDMETSGYSPTVITYNIVLLGLCKVHRIDDAIEVLAEMVEKSCRPNETTYVLLIEGIGFAGWRAEAIDLANSLFSADIISKESLKRLNKTFPLLDAYKDLTHSETKK
ncbi:hypothetical protein RJ639_000022 [Escallonia herrerae]|uniref:Pentatricopeptide repeat-containing protein n=1 Tax=Escallonia herrerae TaxID=1293975 RepID=A0AA88XI04_9ASTE|nr:hypothetical protein RJ639_000022 [Escallonia herrerae]